MNNREIERKWLFNLEDVPRELSPTLTHYRQAYLSSEPEVRIRSKIVEQCGELGEETYMLCLKSVGALTRIEVQKPLSYAEFKDLMILGGLQESDFVQKHYYTIPIGDYQLTVGIVDEGTPSEFCYGEIEFPSEEAANAFIPPSWFGKDVTNDPSYKMKNYWFRTRKGCEMPISGVLKQQEIVPTKTDSVTTKNVCTCCSKTVIMPYTLNSDVQTEHSSMLYYSGTDGHASWICPECYQSKVLPLAEELSSVLHRSEGVDLKLLLNCKSQL